MTQKSVRAYAPATIANVSCGFDVLGLALENLGDEVVLRLQEKPEVSITKIEGDGGKLPLDPTKNTCCVSIIEFLKKIDSKQGIAVELYKKLPLGSGMGSSASSAVAGVWAANALMNYPLRKEDLLSCVMEAERVACGTAHADNVAPSLLGGIVLIQSNHPLEAVSIPTHLHLYCSVLHPDLVVNTKDSRRVLPTEIPLQLATKQWGYIAGLVAGFLKNDMGLISRSMHDCIVEPVRAKLIPHFYAVKEAALSAGALGCSISGSGPTIFALSENRIIAERVSEKMQSVFIQHGIKSNVYTSPINQEGGKII